jgi:hypothetical protein
MEAVCFSETDYTALYLVIEYFSMRGKVRDKAFMYSFYYTVFRTDHNVSEIGFHPFSGEKADKYIFGSVTGN